AGAGHDDPRPPRPSDRRAVRRAARATDGDPAHVLRLVEGGGPARVEAVAHVARGTREDDRVVPGRAGRGLVAVPAVTQPRVDVGVVTFNTAELAVTALRRLFDVDHGVDVRLLVRDNGSSDGTADAIARSVPEADLDV